MTGDNPNHVTRDELRAELKALRNQILLYLGVAVGLLNFDLPNPVTIGAVMLMIGKALYVLLGVRF